MKELKLFQQKAVDRITMYSKDILDGNNIKTITLKSPTGSGKTFMMSQVINKIATEPEFKNYDVCFLWICTGKGNLEEQSYKALTQYFDGYPICYLLENEFSGGRNKIEQNEVAILNWELIRSKDKQGKWTNALMKDKETNNFINIIENTKEDNRKIIIIIDESHTSAKTDRAKELRDEIICPDLTIEMSATPPNFTDALPYIVESNDVIREGLIKKEIIINENIDEICDSETESEIVVLEAAYQKQNELKRIYEDEKLDINPLVIIQLPNKEAGDRKKESIINFLKQKNITTENGKLAIWLTEEKINNEQDLLKELNSPVEFLIFKQAIDTGWDCPRASILVRFREIKSEPFEIQTVGRILRMPQGYHYDNEILNKGYIYTNIQSIEIKKEEYNPNIIKSLCSKRKKVKDFILNSYYKQRISYNDITASFYNVFEEVFCEFFNIKIDEAYNTKENRILIQKKLNIKKLSNDDEIILNETIESNIIDSLQSIKDTDMSKFTLSENDKENYLDSILKSELGGFAPVRSLGIMKKALIGTLEKYLNLEEFYKDFIIKLETIILNNKDTIKQLLNKAVETYKPIKLEEEKRKAGSIKYWYKNWTIPQTRNYNPNTFEKFESKLNLYEPCFLEINRSNPEKKFIEFIENQKNVVWWWKNGSEHMRENFGIKCSDDGTSFQPDFLVMYKNGIIGIYDTKATKEHLNDTKAKAEMLQKYIEEENKKGKKFCGGIIIVDSDHLKINDNKIYNPFNKKPNEWKFFNV